MVRNMNISIEHLTHTYTHFVWIVCVLCTYLDIHTFDSNFVQNKDCFNISSNTNNNYDNNKLRDHFHLNIHPIKLKKEKNLLMQNRSLRIIRKKWRTRRFILSSLDICWGSCRSVAHFFCRWSIPSSIQIIFLHTFPMGWLSSLLDNFT